MNQLSQTKPAAPDERVAQEAAGISRIENLKIALKQLYELRVAIVEEIKQDPIIIELIELKRELSHVDTSIHKTSAALFELRGTLQRPERRVCETCHRFATFMTPIGEKEETTMAAATSTVTTTTEPSKKKVAVPKFLSLADTDPEKVTWATDGKGKCRCPTCGRVRPVNKPLTAKAKDKKLAQFDKARARLLKLAATLGVDPASLVAGAATAAPEPAAAAAPAVPPSAPAVNGKKK